METFKLKLRLETGADTERFAEQTRDQKNKDATKPHLRGVPTYLYLVHLSLLVVRYPTFVLSPIRDVLKDNQVLKFQVPVDRQIGFRRGPPATRLRARPANAANSRCYRFLPQQGISGRAGCWRARRLAAVTCPPSSCSFARRLRASHASLARSPVPSLCSGTRVCLRPHTARFFRAVAHPLSISAATRCDKTITALVGSLVRKECCRFPRCCSPA